MAERDFNKEQKRILGILDNNTEINRYDLVKFIEFVAILNGIKSRLNPNGSNAEAGYNNYLKVLGDRNLIRDQLNNYRGKEIGGINIDDFLRDFDHAFYEAAAELLTEINRYNSELDSESKSLTHANREKNRLETERAAATAANISGALTGTAEDALEELNAAYDEIARLKQELAASQAELAARAGTLESGEGYSGYSSEGEVDMEAISNTQSQGLKIRINVLEDELDSLIGKLDARKAELEARKRDLPSVEKSGELEKQYRKEAEDAVERIEEYLNIELAAIEQEQNVRLGEVTAIILQRIEENKQAKESKLVDASTEEEKGEINKVYDEEIEILETKLAEEQKKISLEFLAAGENKKQIADQEINKIKESFRRQRYIVEANGMVRDANVAAIDAEIELIDALSNGEDVSTAYKKFDEFRYALEDAKVKEFELKLRFLEEDLAQERAGYKALHREFEESRAYCEALERELVQARREGNEEAIAEIVAGLEAMRAENERLEGVIADHQARIREFDAENQELRVDLAAQKAEFERELQTAQREAADAQAALAAARADLETERAAAAAAVAGGGDAAVGALAAATARAETAETRANAAEARVTALTGEVTTKNAEIVAKQAVIDANATQIADLQRDNNDLRRQLAIAQRDLAAAQDLSDRLGRQLIEENAAARLPEFDHFAGEFSGGEYRLFDEIDLGMRTRRKTDLEALPRPLSQAHQNELDDLRDNIIPDLEDRVNGGFNDNTTLARDEYIRSLGGAINAIDRFNGHVDNADELYYDVFDSIGNIQNNVLNPILVGIENIERALAVGGSANIEAFKADILAVIEGNKQERDNLLENIRETDVPGNNALFYNQFAEAHERVFERAREEINQRLTDIGVEADFIKPLSKAKAAPGMSPVDSVFDFYEDLEGFVKYNINIFSPGFNHDLYGKNARWLTLHAMRPLDRDASQENEYNELTRNKESIENAHERAGNRRTGYRNYLVGKFGERSSKVREFDSNVVVADKLSGDSVDTLLQIKSWAEARINQMQRYNNALSAGDDAVKGNALRIINDLDQEIFKTRDGFMEDILSSSLSKQENKRKFYDYFANEFATAYDHFKDQIANEMRVSSIPVTNEIEVPNLPVALAFPVPGVAAEEFCFYEYMGAKFTFETASEKLDPIERLIKAKDFSLFTELELTAERDRLEGVITSSGAEYSRLSDKFDDFKHRLDSSDIALSDEILNESKTLIASVASIHDLVKKMALETDEKEKKKLDTHVKSGIEQVQNDRDNLIKKISGSALDKEVNKKTYQNLVDSVFYRSLVNTANDYNKIPEVEKITITAPGPTPPPYKGPSGTGPGASGPGGPGAAPGASPIDDDILRRINNLEIRRENQKDKGEREEEPPAYEITMPGGKAAEAKQVSNSAVRNGAAATAGVSAIGMVAAALFGGALALYASILLLGVSISAIMVAVAAGNKEDEQQTSPQNRGGYRTPGLEVQKATSPVPTVESPENKPSTAAEATAKATASLNTTEKEPTKTPGK